MWKFNFSPNFVFVSDSVHMYFVDDHYHDMLYMVFSFCCVENINHDIKCGSGGISILSEEESMAIWPSSICQKLVIFFQWLNHFINHQLKTEASSVDLIISISDSHFLYTALHCIVD